MRGSSPIYLLTRFMVKPRVLVGDHKKRAVEKELGDMVQRCGQFNYLY